MADEKLYIRDVPVVAVANRTDKIPLSQGTTEPLTVTIGQIADQAPCLVIAAATDLGGHRAVTVGGHYADSGNTAHAYGIAGVTLQAVAAGVNVPVQTQGELSELSWNWLPSEPVYVGNNGMLTQTPPATGFICIIGVPVNSTTLLINIQQPIILA